jgi:RNA polymerase sigma-70 factor (ECF subfamily)
VKGGLTTMLFGTDNYIENLVDTYSDMILRICYSHMKNMSDAEDITQEVFIKLMEKQPAFESAEHEKLWLIRVAINLCKDKLKSAWFRKTAPLEDTLPGVTKEDSTIIEAVLSLPLKYRTVILLFYFEDYSIAQIASIINTKESTVGSQLSRARNLLKSILKEDFIYE